MDTDNDSGTYEQSIPLVGFLANRPFVGMKTARETTPITG